MIFNSLQFLIFFGIVYVLYLCLPFRGQNRLLLLSSYVFYAAWDWRFLSLIWLSTLVDYFCGRKIESLNDDSKKKLFLILSLFVNLTILGFFKYWNFFARSFQELLAVFGIDVQPRFLSIILPVGISFYTFQTMSYTIDVYWNKIKAHRNFEEFALFVAYFPQLVAGPIERAQGLLAQVVKPRKITLEVFGAGLRLFLWGMFKKIVIADRLAIYIDYVFADIGGHSFLTILFASYLFVFQIYCDFSGYSDVARGVSKMMGFDIMLNFKFPLFAVNIQDFWNQWHISLSTWFRDYVYTPLFLSYRALSLNIRLVATIMTTMALMGLWHGAAWNFILFGLFEGVLLSVYALTRPFLKKTLPMDNGLWWVARVLFVFQLSACGLFLFRVGSVVDIGLTLNAMITNWGIVNIPGVFMGHVIYGVLGITTLLLLENRARILKTVDVLYFDSVWLRWLAQYAIVYGIILFAVYEGGGFIYFQF